jgi:hypothetical protein
MVSETKLPLPMRNGKPGRYDFEYRREGTCNLFMFLQPLAGCWQVAGRLLAGWRHIKVTDQRTKQDFAGCMNDLVEIHFPEAEKIRVVLDNLNTHSPIRPPPFTRLFRLSQPGTSPRNWSFTIRLNIAVG